MSKGVQIAIGATVIAAMFGWYGATSLDADASFTYYQNLTEFHSAVDGVGDSSAAGRARVHGYVAVDSIRRDVPSRQVRFTVQNEPPHAGGEIGRTLEVVLASLETPDLFKDGAEVVVEGQMIAAQGGVMFVADKVLAKCPSKFEAKRTESAQL